MRTRATSVEVEVKLLVRDPAKLRAIARLRRLGPYVLRPRDAVRLHSIYVDTKDFALAKRKVALRLRRDGHRWEVTAKWAGRVVDGALHRRPELTAPLPCPPTTPFCLPKGALRTRLIRLVGWRELTPILITDIHRRRIDILLPTARHGATPVAELAIDRAHLRAPDERVSRRTYVEIEIEQRRGTQADLLALARLLRRRFKLLPSRESKFARGLAAVYRARNPYS